MTPEQAYFHCKKHGRNEELEKIILADPEFAYNYALDIIKDRWIEAESVIANDSKYSYYYAQDIIKGKLPESMHNAMLIHADNWAKEYLKLLKNLLIIRSVRSEIKKLLIY